MNRLKCLGVNGNLMKNPLLLVPEISFFSILFVFVIVLTVNVFSHWTVLTIFMLLRTLLSHRSADRRRNMFASHVLFIVRIMSIMHSSTSCGENDINLRQGVLSALLKDYDKNIIPSVNTSLKTEVEMTIQEINSINEFTSSFVADIYYSQIWMDTRLRFENMTCQTNLSLDESVINQIWTPRVAISNSKVAALHSSPTPNTLLIILNNGKSAIFEKRNVV